MQKKRKNYAAIWLMIGVGIVMMLFGRSNSFGDISGEKESLNDLENQKSNAEEILAGLEDKKSDSEAYLNELDNQMSVIAAKIYQLQTEMTAANEEIIKFQDQIAEAEVTISEQYAAMKLRIQFMYENGNANYLSMLFESKSMADFLNQAEYIMELTSYDRQMLEQLQAEKNKLELAKKNLETELAELKMLEDAALAEQDAAEKLQAAKQQEIEQINASISDAEQQIKDLDEDIEAQQELIAEMESIEARRKAEEESRKKAEEESRKKAEEESRKKAEEESRKKAEQASKGEQQTTASQEETTKKPSENTNNAGYVWPVSGYSRISSYFGWRDNPFGNGPKEYHNGIDIPAPTGTPIKAIASGEVAWSYYSGSAGNWIGIDHGNGLYSVYMHMSSRIAQTGDKITAGEVIGLVGSTGRSSGPHLHLGVRLNGAYVNPLNYVSP